MSKNRRILVVVACLLGAASLYETVRQFALRERAEFERSEYERKTNALETERQHRFAKIAVGSEPPASAPVPAVSAAPSSDATSPPKPRPKPDASHLMASHPEVRALFQTAFHARFDREYHALFERLSLSTEQQQRFKERLFQNRLDQLDLRWTGKAMGADSNAPEAQALRRQQEEALRVDLEAILGPDGNRAIEDFRRANGTRDFVNKLGTTMTLAGVSMSLAQADRLVQAIAETSLQYRQGGNAMPWDADWDVIMTQAPSFLSPAQVEILRLDGDDYIRRLVWKLPAFYAQRGTPAKP
jgi:hypothetical protein